MVDPIAREVGERIRFRRVRAGKTQAVVAGLAGIAPDYLYQIERGRKLPTLPVLMGVAAALGAPVSDLLDDADGSGARRPSVEIRAGGERLADAGPAAGDRLWRALTRSVDMSVEPVALGQLVERVGQAWRIWQSSPTRYTQVGMVLDELVPDVERAVAAATGTSTAPVAHRAAGDLYGLTRSVAKRSGRVDLALVAADRSMRAANLSGDELRVGVARWNLAHAALAEGHHEHAEEVAVTAAERLRRSDRSGPGAAAVHGSLMLVAGVAAARSGQPWVARDRIRAVAAVAWKLGECNTLWTAFGPTNVAMHLISVDVIAGQISQANQLADTLDYSRSPSIERRVAFLLEQARSLVQRAHYGPALSLLRRAYDHAPEDLAFRHAPEDATTRPQGRDIVHEIVQRARPRTATAASALARRLEQATLT